ncbi:hypothetical protein BDV98DRAFT_580523 [Pterulicium gracile]|uniref:Uncharacterized protein n=1 Tax=Pterulicium gracile TaxID=1884261 RepID=A0A5C3QVD9_9AGAR|nr:hypothetical protein BDV98DRAFT_580523 [Pterula gracilis]
MPDSGLSWYSLLWSFSRRSCYATITEVLVFVVHHVLDLEEPKARNDLKKDSEGRSERLRYRGIDRCKFCVILARLWKGRRRGRNSELQLRDANQALVRELLHTVQALWDPLETSLTRHPPNETLSVSISGQQPTVDVLPDVGMPAQVAQDRLQLCAGLEPRRTRTCQKL